MIRDGTAALEHIRGFAIRHYEMTTRDSGPYMAQGYIKNTLVEARRAIVQRSGETVELAPLITPADAELEAAVR